MRIAQVAPPWLPIPAGGYGGIEHVVSTLTETLVARGHDVTLFASGDSTTAARLVAHYPVSLGNNADVKRNPLVMLPHIHEVFARHRDFDVIHVHDIPEACFLADLIPTPVVHTLHRSVANDNKSGDRHRIYKRFASQRYISISDAQRRYLPELNYIATVHNGVDPTGFSLGSGSGRYLVWLGRVTPKKGVVEAIKVARSVGMKLKIAAFVDKAEEPYFSREVQPLVDGVTVEYVGELKHDERRKLLADAFALLFPIKWNEPFGLVMAEAMASGTPVVATARGSVPEVVADGVTGFIVPVTAGMLADDVIDEESIPKMADAVRTLMAMPPDRYTNLRAQCRQHVERSFTVASMSDKYEIAYRAVSGT